MNTDQRLLEKQAVWGMGHILNSLKDCGSDMDQGLSQVTVGTSDLKNYVQIHILAACHQ
jgi:hypothetical protein